jgi:hypothetical protein
VKKLWLSDIDGTVALMEGRSPYQWDRVYEDKPNMPVITVIRAMIRDGHEFGFVSGRMEQCRRETTEWLQREIPELRYAIPLLWMREDGDSRPDEVVKLEIYERIAAYYEVQGVFDDRAKVIAMWRSLGLTCFAVADGNF